MRNDDASAHHKAHRAISRRVTEERVKRSGHFLAYTTCTTLLATTATLVLKLAIIAIAKGALKRK